MAPRKSMAIPDAWTTDTWSHGTGVFKLRTTAAPKDTKTKPIRELIRKFVCAAPGCRNVNDGVRIPHSHRRGHRTTPLCAYDYTAACRVCGTVTTLAGCRGSRPAPFLCHHSSSTPPPARQEEDEIEELDDDDGPAPTMEKDGLEIGDVLSIDEALARRQARAWTEGRGVDLTA